MRARLLMIMVAMAVCATGCSGVIPGTALPVPHYVPYDPANADVAFGDFSTVDPCALVDVAALPSYLNAVRQKTESFDHCAFKIDVAGEVANAEVGELDTSTGDDLTGAEQVAGGITLYPDTLTYGSCTAYLAFTTDPMYLASYVSAETGDGSDALCTASQEIAKDVATVIARQRVAHVTGVPAKSLQRVDACGLVDSSVLDAAGLDTPITSPAKHQCEWSDKSGGADEYVDLSFLVGPHPEPTMGATPIQIAGRQSVEQTTNDSDFGECQIDTAGIVFGQPQQDLVEIAEVFVYGSGQSGDATCQLAATVAAAAWPKLPATS